MQPWLVLEKGMFLIPGCILACQQSWKGLLVEGEEKPRGSEPQGEGMASRFYW